MFLCAAMTAAVIALSGCAESPEPSATTPSAPPEGRSSPSAVDDVATQPFPDVIEAELSPDGEEFSVSVTISSPYDSPERYADGWRVLTPDGAVLAEHTLHHDHASEQPFTRSRGPFDFPPRSQR